MRIGLVRHFKVNHQAAAMMNSKEFSEWVHHYDEAEITDMEISTDVKWDHCYSSDLPRAINTANRLCRCETTETPLLREIPLAPFININMKLPFSIWNVAGRLAWYFSRPSQEESHNQTKKRAEKVLSFLEDTEHKKILVVSHGFFLMVLEKELEKKGYIGKRTRKFKNGEIVIYEKG